MDNSKVRTAAELEQKYNLSKLAKNADNIETNKKEILHIQNELNDFIIATTDNFEEVEAQLDGKVDTYYYSGEPSFSNLPASEWTSDEYPSHEGDLYYDQSTGYCYRFTYITNMFDKNSPDILLNTGLSGTNGTTSSNNSRNTSYYIKVHPQSSYSLTGATFAAKCFYNANKTFISSIRDNEFVTPQNTVYLRFAWNNTLDFTNLKMLPATIYDWVRIKDDDITGALAAANAAQDTADHKRRIFTSQPTTPYDNGDLWVGGSNGDIMACQVSRASGSFNANDWILASKYTDNTVANAIVDEMGGQTTTVLSGQVVTIMNNYAKFTDLATGGSTEIAGENITTGNIKSANYVSGTSGTNINLTNGTISTPNVSIDNDGIKLANNAKVIGSNGLMNTYLFPGTSNKMFCGYEMDYFGSTTIKKLPIRFNLSIPDGFEMTKAIIHLYHSPVFYYVYSGSSEVLDTIGYSRSLIIQKGTNVGSRKINVHTSEYDLNDTTNYSRIYADWYNKDGSLRNSYFTASTPSSSSYDMDEAYTANFASAFKSGESTVPGIYDIKLETNTNPGSSWTETDVKARTGWVYAMLEIEGYMTYS